VTYSAAVGQDVGGMELELGAVSVRVKYSPADQMKAQAGVNFVEPDRGTGKASGGCLLPSGYQALEMSFLSRELPHVDRGMMRNDEADPQAMASDTVVVGELVVETLEDRRTSCRCWCAYTYRPPDSWRHSQLQSWAGLMVAAAAARAHNSESWEVGAGVEVEAVVVVWGVPQSKLVQEARMTFQGQLDEN
jgi:hypothetical protein